MEYKIRHKREGWSAATGFYSLARALNWLENFNPSQWMDKNLKASDFEIVGSDEEIYTERDLD